MLTELFVSQCDLKVLYKLSVGLTQSQCTLPMVINLMHECTRILFRIIGYIICKKCNIPPNSNVK